MKISPRTPGLRVSTGGLLAAVLSLLPLLPATPALGQGGTRQVQIETKLVELRQTDLENLGIDWGAIRGDVVDTLIEQGKIRRARVGKVNVTPINLFSENSVDYAMRLVPWDRGALPVLPGKPGVEIDTGVKGDLGHLGSTPVPDPGAGDSFPGRNPFPLGIPPILGGFDRDFDGGEETAVHVPTTLSDDRITDPGDVVPIKLRITPTVQHDGTIQLDVSNDGTYFRRNERTFDLFGGGARGTMGSEQIVNRQVGTEQVFDGVGFIDVPIFVQDRFEEGSFLDEASLFGMRCLCFYGYHFGLGMTMQYFDGDLDDAWSGELNAIVRLPIETPHFGFAPYFIGGVGGFFGDEDHAIGSVGGGLEFRPNGNWGFFTEARKTWADDDDREFTSVVGGFRIVIDGVGTRRVKTRVLLRDGQTALLGGIFNPNPPVERKIPGLGDIPMVGSLFRSSVRAERQALPIFVTPRIIIQEEEE